MSCFVMKTESLASIAAFTADALNQIEMGNGNTYGPLPSYDLPRVFRNLGAYNITFHMFDSKAMFRLLYALNVSAWNGRYDETESIIAPKLDPDNYRIHKCFDYLGAGKYRVQGWEAQIAGMIDCWLCQTCEDATRDNPLRDAMEELNKSIAVFIVHNQLSYTWGRPV